MAQPKILTSQADVGTNPSQFASQADLFPVGSGRIIKAVHGPLLPASGTSVIPLDNTTPLIAEGTEFGTAVFTTTVSTSHVHYDFTINVDASANNTPLIVAVFRDNTCICAGVVTIDTAGRPKTFGLTGHDSPGLGTFTYSGRIGVAAAGPTWYVNSVSSGNNLGGTMNTSFRMVEHA